MNPAEPAAQRTVRALSRYLPILAWLPSYQPRWLRADIIAGMTVWALLVPGGIAYAQLAGVPAVAALSAAPVALLAYAVFGSSRQAVVGATSALSIMSAAAIAPLAAGHIARYTSLAAALALLVGVLALLFGLARLGFVAAFLSRPVLIGFIFGLALVVAAGQLPKLLGLTSSQGNFFERVWSVVTRLDRANGWTLLVALVSLALLFGLKRAAPRIPAALAAIVAGILAASILGLRQHGVAVIGSVPAGLPRLGLPGITRDDLVALLPGALGMVLVGYAEHLGSIRASAMAHHYDVDPDQELIALGVSNVGAGLFRGFAVGGGLSQTTVNDLAGARSEISGIIAAVLVVITGLVLTPLFYNLPEATLGAIVIVAVWDLFDVGAMRRYLRLSREEFALALIALAGELAFNVLPGLLLAVALSFLALIYRSSRPNVALLGRFPGEHTYADLALHPTNETVPGLVIVRLDAQMFFANDGVLHRRLRALARGTPPPRAILLDLEATTLLDISSAETLGEIEAELRSLGITFLLARVRDPVLDMLRRSGVAARIGEQHMYHMVDQGVQGYLSWQHVSNEHIALPDR